jgi:hypothetical protein
MAYDKLGRHADAEAMLAKSRATDGDTGATAYSVIYAQWATRLGLLRTSQESMVRSAAQGATLPGGRTGAEVSGFGSIMPVG